MKSFWRHLRWMVFNFLQMVFSAIMGIAFHLIVSFKERMLKTSAVLNLNRKCEGSSEQSVKGDIKNSTAEILEFEPFKG